MNEPARYKPRLALRVGITGHRRQRLADRLPQVRGRLQTVLESIQAAAAEIGADNRDLYGEDAARLVLISAMADGADLTAASVADALGFEVQVVLPFSGEATRADLTDPADQAEFDRIVDAAAARLAARALDGDPTDEQTRKPAYSAVGQELLRQSDVLVAVWDGTEAQGVGGTAEVVAAALERGRPVVWIDPWSPSEAVLARIEEGRGVRGAGLTALPDRLRPVLELQPQPRPPGEKPDTNPARLREYLDRERPGRCRGNGAFIWFTSLLLIRRPGARLLPVDPVAAARRDWPFPLDLLGPQGERLAEHYAHADHAANYYSRRYRDSFTSIYILAPLAVLTAVLGYLIENSARVQEELNAIARFFWQLLDPGGRVLGLDPSWVGLGSAAFELLLLVVVIAVWLRARQKRYHEKWIDYRLLAERLRHLALLAPLDRIRELAVPDRAAWAGWYLRAVIREAGLYWPLRDAQAARSLETGLGELLRDQEGYHETNARKMRTIARRLGIIVRSLFILAAIATLGEVVLELIIATGEGTGPNGLVEAVLLLVAIVFPAVGASLHGFASQGEFEKLRRRSREQQAQLAELSGELAAAGTLTEGELGDLAERAGQTLEGELADWRQVFEEKRVPRPSEA